ncbi:hsp70 protein [Seiridium cupressi]
MSSNISHAGPSHQTQSPVHSHQLRLRPSHNQYPRTLAVCERSALGRVCLSIDFGTSTSEVSYAVIEPGQNSKTDPPQVKYITNWPDDPNKGLDNSAAVGVPSEIVYLKDGILRRSHPPPGRSSTRLQKRRGSTPSFGTFQSANQRELGFIDVFDEDESMSDCEDEDTLFLHDSPWNAGNITRHHTEYIIWGFDAQAKCSPEDEKMRGFKLLLKEDPMTEQFCRELAPRLAKIGYTDPSKAHISVISDYLSCLLRHVKSELIACGKYREYDFEVILCIPAVWDQKACRDTQVALARAFTRADFDQVKVEQNSINGLFLVSEPEAAAAWILQNNNDLLPDDTFMLVDAGGGGTVDVSIYTISQKTPLRLEAEEVAPVGALCGSAYLNGRFYDHIRKRLDGELYLEEERGRTLDEIAHEITVTDFETRLKRNFNCFEQPPTPKIVRCPGLRENSNKRFLRDRIVISHTSAVSSGGILRGLNKDRGPLRFIRSSYGILRTFPWDENREEFLNSGLTKPRRNAVDGGHWVKDTIYWVLKRGDEVVTLLANRRTERVWKSEPISCMHSFLATSSKFICEELLYVSDSATESYYLRDHEKNRDAEEVGAIITDFTFLREQGLVEPVQNYDATGNPIGKEHYEIEYKLYLEVVGRDLQCHAEYGDRTRQTSRINIASAFDPGTD